MFCDWIKKKLYHFLNQSQVKPKPIMPHSCTLTFPELYVSFVYLPQVLIGLLDCLCQLYVYSALIIACYFLDTSPVFIR